MQVQQVPTKQGNVEHKNAFRFNRPAPNPYGGNFLLTPSLADYLTPDVSLPDQFFGKQKCDDGLGPERALMYAVLKDGIRCFYKNVGATRRKYKKMWAEAEEWILAESYEDPFSFCSICDALGIDPGSLRTRLVAWKDDELMRREITGDTASVQVGRSPFPTPIDLDGLDTMSAEDTAESLDNTDWSDEDNVSLEDLEYEEPYVHAA